MKSNIFQNYLRVCMRLQRGPEEMKRKTEAGWFGWLEVREK